jgi:hypothetical protein
MYKTIANVITKHMPPDASLIGYGNGHRSWLFNVSWPAAGEAEHAGRRYTVFIRIEHDVIEDGVRFELENMEGKIAAYLKYQFAHFRPVNNPFLPADAPHDLWTISTAVLD